MKIGRKKNNTGLPTGGGGGLTAPTLNKAGSWGKIFIVIAIVAILIGWVISIGKKAEETVSVCMVKEAMYKNQQLTEENLIEYKMLRGEFEKYAITDNNGQLVRRLIEWKDRGQAIGMFAAYPIQRETLLEVRSLYTERTDNTDSVMYSFPGKEIVQLDVNASDLNSFKTFLQPGDRLNIDAIYSETIQVETSDGYGGTVEEDVEVFKSAPVFTSIMIADIINGNGNSVLDIYASYNDMTVQQQSILDQDEAFLESVEPRSLLVALTPDEKESYYEYLAKSNIEFKVSLPQRIE